MTPIQTKLCYYYTIERNIRLFKNAKIVIFIISFVLTLKTPELLYSLNNYESSSVLSSFIVLTGNISDASVGTEELAHMEMICAIVHQLTRKLTPDQLIESGFDKYYVDHTLALWPTAASGAPWTATYFQSKGDPITDIHEDMAADGTNL